MEQYSRTSSPPIIFAVANLNSGNRPKPCLGVDGFRLIIVHLASFQIYTNNVYMESRAALSILLYNGPIRR